MWLLTLLLSTVISTVAATDSDEPKTVFDFVQPRVRYTNVALSKEVLRVSDVERWAELLNASEAQLQFMIAQHRNFVREHNAVVEREAPLVLARSAEIHSARLDEGGYTDAHATRMTALNRQCARLRRQLEHVEQTYIDSIEPLLSPDQVRRLPLLRNEALRRQSRVRVTSLPWAHVDVRLLWETVDTERLSPEQREAVDHILWEHDHAVTPLIRSMTDAFWNSAANTSRRVVDWQQEAISVEEYNRLYERSKMPFLRSLLRISVLNESAVAQIVESVSIDIGDRFLERAKAAAYPMLYPDWTALHQDMGAILNDDDLDTELTAAVDRLLAAYALDYQNLAQDLERYYLDWAKLNVVGRSGHYNQHFADALGPYLQKRQQLRQQWVETLAETVGEEVLQRHGVSVVAPGEDDAGAEPL